MTDVADHFCHLAGEVVGHSLHFHPSRQPLRLGPEIVVAHVAAGAVGHHGDERRVLAISTEQALHPVSEQPKIIGTNMTGLIAADVVQPVVGQQRQWPAVGVPNIEHRHLRINRPGRLEQIGAARWIHFHLVAPAAKRIGSNRHRLHKPTPVVYVLRCATEPPANLGRRKMMPRSRDAVGDAPGDKLGVRAIPRLGMNPHHRRSGVRVRGGDENVFRCQAGRLPGQ